MEATTPPANIYEGNGQLSVAAPIPGAHPEHVEVIVTPTRVHVAATCKYAQDNQHYHRHDWRGRGRELGADPAQQGDPAPPRAARNPGGVGAMAPLSATTPPPVRP